MADIRDWGAFLRGRWNWSKAGFEKNFPRGCQFTDVDASVEFDGRMLLIETKHHDGIGSCEYPSVGQLMSLRSEVKLGKTVFVLYGCGPCSSPQALRILGSRMDKSEDVWHDWRDVPSIEERRKLFKYHVDVAMGLRDANEEDMWGM